MKAFICVSLSTLLVVTSLQAADKEADLKPFEGSWEAVELSEDGHVVPREAISEWLPSGGRFDIVDNAIIVTSPHDGKKSAKLFSIDATQYPRGIDILSRDKKDALGIYKFDDDRLVVCLGDSDDGTRPTEFSARKGSKRMLLVLKRVPASEEGKKVAAEPANSPVTAGSGVTAKVLSDADVTKMLNGTWRYRDEAGALVVTLTEDGKWSSIRESQELRLFQKVFVRTPISSGKWSVQNGTLTFHCLASIHLSRVNHQLPFAIRSITDRDFIFVDSMGRLGKATKVQ
jgi:uncharacterized protein (TIGR03067 family)